MAKKNKSDKTVNHYKIILYNETTLHEVTSFTITRLNILAVTGLIFVIIALMVSVLFIYTPLNAFLPSYTDSKLRKELVESAIRTDSIYKVLQNREEYFAKIRCIMEGEDFETYKETHDTVTPERQKVDFTKSKHDSILRTLIE